MTVQEIRQILESPYDRKVWKDFLQTQFTNNKLNAEDRVILLHDNNISKQCLSLGSYEINDYTRVGIFEIILDNKINISRNRVALRNLLKDITQQVAAAMVVFVQGDQWRFSYISKRKIKNKETNTIEDKETAPKRYTYLFGRGEKALTAAMRFEKLIQKQKENIFHYLELDDFEDAFSVEKLSNEFFKNYKETYENFVEFLTGKRYIKSGNRWVETTTHEAHFQLRNYFNNDNRAARDFCKRLMGRIVFLYFIQKKGWMAVPRGKTWGDGDLDYLFNLYNNATYKDSFYSEYLVPLFFDTLNNQESENEKNEFRFPYLNGGLFDKSQDYRYDKLSLPAEIFDKLFTVFNNFNFTVYEDAPDEHTVAVDPEMLGHIFENLLEDNKDKGAFYTPKEIVHYMCTESLKNYIILYSKKENDADFKQRLNKYFEFYDVKIFSNDEVKQVDRALEDVKICDPAIGSGAFPMGLLHEIYNLKIPIEDNKGFKAKSPANLKKHIIEESIYGVDIDSGAVDIARLRFWLSLVVDEEVPQPLPNLSFKIVCANTLIPLGTLKGDFSGSHEIAKELENIRHDYFDASKHAKGELERKFRNTQNKLFNTAKDWVTREDSEIYQKLLEFNPFEDNSCSWFDPWWMMGIKDGFDIVIGNPPYIKEYTNKSAFDGFRKSKYYQGKMDLWYGFACIMIDHLKPNGIQCFIAQNNWITSAGASKLRDKILSDTKLLSFVDFGNYKVFASAGIQTMIYVVKKEKTRQGEKYTATYSLLTNESMAEESLSLFLDVDVISDDWLKYPVELSSTTNNAKAFTFNTNDDDLLLNEIALKANFRFLEKEVAQGIVFPQDFLNKRNLETLNSKYSLNTGIFVLNQIEIQELRLNTNEKAIIKPYFTTENFKRYFANPINKLWLIYTDSSFKNPKNIQSYPNIKLHLDKFAEVITSDNKPYGLHRAREERFFKGEKIIVQRKCPNKPVFTYTDFDCYVSATFYVIQTPRANHKFLTALLNSRLVEYWLRNKGKMQGNNFQIDKEPLLNIPIVNPEDVSQFEILVDYLLYLYDNTKSNVLSHTDNDRLAVHVESVINMLVYELYFLNHMKESGLDISTHLNLKSFEDDMDDSQKAKIIEDFYLWLQKPENPVRQRILLVETRSTDTIDVINKATI